MKMRPTVMPVDESLGPKSRIIAVIYLVRTNYAAARSFHSRGCSFYSPFRVHNRHSTTFLIDHRCAPPGKHVGWEAHPHTAKSFSIHRPHWNRSASSLVQHETKIELEANGRSEAVASCGSLTLSRREKRRVRDCRISSKLPTEVYW
jgi:hypothetical protein